MHKSLRISSSAKSQSAMEYLMTYGWAILVIAVVLIALFELGVFNATQLMPKAPPGSCYVTRSVAGINLEGECNVLPEYVASFSGTPSSFIYVNSVNPDPGTSVTISLWVDPKNSTWLSGGDGVLLCGDHGPVYACSFKFGYGSACAIYTDGTHDGEWLYLPSVDSQSPIPLNQWSFWVCSATLASDNGSSAYLNGVFASNQPYPQTYYSPGYPWTMGIGDGAPYAGWLANVQVYNTTLSPAQIKALYLEGIGGAPVSLLHVVAWWPLNGNANDYSGNGNNGVATGVNWPGYWVSDYSIP